MAVMIALTMLTCVMQVAWALRFDREAVVQYAQRKYAASNVVRVQQWFALLDRAAALPDSGAQLRVINDFWNTRVREGTDKSIWRNEDYWATPLQSLVKGQADCEDFVIGKYFSLVYLGVPSDKLRLIYVRARLDGQSIAHMVLGYYETPSSDPLILDNLNPEIRPATRRPDLSPVFSFTADTVYAAGRESRGVERLTRWQAVLKRMQEEGFQP